MSPWQVAFAVAAALAALAAVYWFAIGGLFRPRTPGWLTQQPYAHRGLHFDARHPENSRAAFRAAAEAGYGIELDVHLAADGRTVVFHDDSLERMTGDPRMVSAAPFAELRTLRLGESHETIPTLAEALATISGRVPVLVEIKSRVRAGALEDAVAREVSGYCGPLAIVSFDPLSLRRVRQLAPQSPRGQITGLFSGSGPLRLEAFALRHLLLNFISRPDFIVDEMRAAQSWDTRVQRSLRRKLLVYAPATPAEAHQATENADGFIGEPGSLQTR